MIVTIPVSIHVSGDTVSNNRVFMLKKKVPNTHLYPYEVMISGKYVNGIIYPNAKNN